MSAELIRERSGLETLAADLRDLKRFAFDTEFMREGRYHARLCLIQIAVPGRAVAIDPLAVEDLSPFVSLLKDPEVEVLVHSADQDMQIFFDGGTEAPRNVFDTQIAAAYVGHGDRVGYGALVKTVLGIELEKTETFTNWCRRPLTPKQMDYALDDVRHLLPLHEKLTADITELGRKECLREALASYEDPARYQVRYPELYRNISRVDRLEPPDLAVLREVAAWREREARTVDRPRHHVLHDVVMIEIVRRRPANRNELAAMRGVHPQLVRRSGEALLRAVRKGARTPPEDYPAKVERKTLQPAEQLIVDLLETFLRARAPELRISPGCLATRPALVELVIGHLNEGPEPDIPILKGWRREMIGADLEGFLAGRLRLAFDPKARRVSIDR